MAENNTIVQYIPTIIVLLIWGIPFLIINFRLFKKANQPAWAAIVPVYGYIVYGKIGRANKNLALTCGILNFLGIIYNMTTQAGPVLALLMLFPMIVAGLVEFGLSIYLFVKFMTSFKTNVSFWFLYILFPLAAIFIVRKVEYFGSLGYTNTSDGMIMNNNYARAPVVVQAATVYPPEMITPQNNVSDATIETINTAAANVVVGENDWQQKMLPTKNKPSLVSYYCSVFGLIPFLGLPLSVAAIVTGIIALKKYKNNPTPGAKGHAITGLVLGAIPIILTLIITILALGAHFDTSS